MSTLTPTAATIASVRSTDQQSLLILARQHAKDYMSQPHFDASHDWAHVERVVALAKKILAESQSSDTLDPVLVELSALLHDVGDTKYSNGGDDPKTEVKRVLLDYGAEKELAEKVQTIVNAVSYRHEVANPDVVEDVLKKYPELGIVQDADRLDAIGAVGIGRLFTFGGAKNRKLNNTMDHAEEKLIKLEAMMKTQEGKRLARVRTARLQQFMDWWAEEETELKTT